VVIILSNNESKVIAEYKEEGSAVFSYSSYCILMRHVLNQRSAF